MSLEINGAGIGSAAWKLLNTGLGAAGTAMGATALGSKTSEEYIKSAYMFMDDVDAPKDKAKRYFLAMIKD